jgi:hypothetical protein
MFKSHVSQLLYLNYFKLLSTAFMLNILWTRHLSSAATVNFENYLMFCIHNDLCNLVMRRRSSHPVGFGQAKEIRNSQNIEMPAK